MPATTDPAAERPPSRPTVNVHAGQELVMNIIGNIAVTGYAIIEGWHPSMLAWPFLVQSAVLCIGTAVRLKRCDNRDFDYQGPRDLFGFVFFSCMGLLYVMQDHLTAGALGASFAAAFWQGIATWRRLRQDAHLQPRARDLLTLFDARVLVVTALIPFSFVVAGKALEKWLPGGVDNPIVVLLLFGMVKIVADAWTLRHEQRILLPDAKDEITTDARELERTRYAELTEDPVPWEFDLATRQQAGRDEDSR